MSDQEEPPAKVSKTDEGMEEGGEDGHEEWLNESILTDDDFTATDPEQGNSQDLNDTGSTHYSDNPDANTDDGEHPEAQNQDIEETLNNFEKEEVIQTDAKKPIVAVKQEPKNVKEENNQMEKSDGNDTDDLLRMLGEDEHKNKKKLTKTVKDVRNNIKDEFTSDEEYEYSESALSKLKMAKTAISKKLPPKAEPEDMGDGDDDATDASSDEGKTVQRMFTVNKLNVAQTKPNSAPNTHGQATITTKHVVNIVNKPNVPNKPVLKKVVEKPKVVPYQRSVLKTSTPVKVVTSKPLSENAKPYSRAVVNKIEPKKITFQTEVKPPPKPVIVQAKIVKEEMKKEPEEKLIEEFLDEEELDSKNLDFESELDDELSKGHQRIMKPERMDETVPSDDDSNDEDGSLYDEMPSSDSDDMDDWFQLDIRQEKAGNYLPLLGPKAKDLLLAEKKRVTSRVTNLKQSLKALTESGKRQAEELRSATMTLAELDDMLKAA